MILHNIYIILHIYISQRFLHGYTCIRAIVALSVLFGKQRYTWTVIWGVQTEQELNVPLWPLEVIQIFPVFTQQSQQNVCVRQCHTSQCVNLIWRDSSLPEKIEMKGSAFSQFLHTILDSKLELCYIICSLYFFIII